VHYEFVSWTSSVLRRDMPMHVFGHAGAKLVVFPTSLGNHSEWPDRRMHEVIREHLTNGWVQMYCLDQVHNEGWYNKALHPSARAWRQLEYDRYLVEEFLPFAHHKNPNPFVIATGASFGAYHAACFAFRHPDKVHRLIGMSGLYDIRHMTGGYQDENVYHVNPSEFMRHEWEGHRLEAFRRQDIILAVGRDDPAYENNEQLTTTLWGKGIGNALRVWDGFAHDWPWWERMLVRYIGGHD